MTRRVWLSMAALLAGCGGRSEMPSGLFPESAAGGWRRGAVRDLAASDSPDPVPRNEVELLRQADYDGPGKLQARVYRLRSAQVSSVLAQRWRPSADTVFFDVGRYFVVVKWQAADRKALQEFVREVETRLSAARGRE